MQEEPIDSREPALSQGTKSVYASSQPIVHFPAKHAKRPRKRPKRLNKTKALERPFYGSFNSQSQIQLARGILSTPAPDIPSVGPWTRKS
jgi:hypothetical protein